MSAILVSSRPVSSDEYRRQARRIRASFARDPLLRHHALTGLAHRRDAAAGSVVASAGVSTGRATSLLSARSIKTSARRVPPLATTTATTSARYLPAEPGSATSAVERGFADHAAASLQSAAFTFSDRARLLSRAQQLGIPRFRANLILALEQHRLDPARVTPSQIKDNPAGWLGNLLVIVCAEAAIVGLFVWACRL